MRFGEKKEIISNLIIPIIPLNKLIANGEWLKALRNSCLYFLNIKNTARTRHTKPAKWFQRRASFFIIS